MSAEEDSKKSGLNYVLLIGVLLVVVISLFTVPFAAIGLAVKKSGMLGKEAALEAATTEQKENARQLDLSGLRATLEKAASGMIQDPNLKTITEFIKIETPAAMMAKTKQTVGDVLSQNHHQYVEAIDPNQIRIIVILKSKEWPDVAAKLMEAADMEGFIYRGPKQTETAGNADTVIAEIEITRK